MQSVLKIQTKIKVSIPVELKDVYAMNTFFIQTPEQKKNNYKHSSYVRYERVLDHFHPIQQDELFKIVKTLKSNAAEWDKTNLRLIK